MGLAHEARRRRQDQLRERHTLLDELLETCLPSWRWTSPAGGLTIWARLPSGDAEALAGLARDRGVDIAPGPYFCADGSAAEHLRLPFSLPPPVLETGIRRLAEAWRDLESGRAEASTSAPLV